MLFDYPQFAIENPYAKRIRKFYNITKSYEYIHYQEILFSEYTQIFISPNGKYVGLLSGYLSNPDIPQLNIHIYSLPDMELISETIELFNKPIVNGIFLLYEINWLGEDATYELINCIPNEILNDDYYTKPEYYFLSYQHGNTLNQSFMSFYSKINHPNYTKYTNIHETAIPIGQCPKYKYTVSNSKLDIYARKDFFIRDVCEYINKIYNMEENTYIPIELYEVIVSYMLPETILIIINKLK